MLLHDPGLVGQATGLRYDSAAVAHVAEWEANTAVCMVCYCCTLTAVGHGMFSCVGSILPGT